MLSKVVVALTIRLTLGECSGDCQAKSGALMQVRTSKQRGKGESEYESPYDESPYDESPYDVSNTIPGYVVTDMWSEVCGKGCDTAGMTCIMEPMSPKECAEACDALDECKAFQMPEADNGFHGWCVWFDYNVQPQDNSHYCHEGNYVYNKEMPDNGANGGYVDCNWETEETCYDDSWSPVGCELISEGGCPCKAGEIKCGGDEFYAGWCQEGPCPVHCDWQTEETCFDENWLAVSCSPIGEGGCPCPSPQIKCGAHDGYAGWCQDGPCPVECDWNTEYTCYDENWLAVSCANKTSGGCPCPSPQIRCGSDEHYEGWCQDGPCPVTCNWQIEETCYDDSWNAVSCALISEGGCPCKAGQSKCGAMEEPHPYAGWCHDGACPLQCDWHTEETCYDDNWVAVSCASISEGGCPCKAGQQKCGSFPEDDIAGWCSDWECPITCNWKSEEYCYDDNWVLTGCAAISDGGCPCSSGKVKCGAYPEDNIAGWCQEAPCPLTCNWKIEETCYDDSWSPVSCALISDGGCPCPDGQTKCGGYAAGTYGSESAAYAGFCTDACYLNLQQAKHENAAELVLSVRGQYHVFALGGKEKRALRKELKQMKLNHAVKLHTGHLNMTLSSFLATHTGDAVEFASLAGNHSRASNLLKSLRPHLHAGAVLQFRDLMQPKEKKQLSQLLESNHKAGFHLAPIKEEGKDELLFRITGTK